MTSKCIPAVVTRKGKNFGKYASISHSKLLVRKMLGPPPFPKALARHLCQNDSMAPNGFVCCNPEHVVWGTHTENIRDRPTETRKRVAVNAGKASAKARRLKSTASSAHS